ncbi:MAG TPA: hypothetical protein VHM30_19525 [Gemmatimonadaceae bacterium]|nr:hypothetical protein [Gemmatimonadaceae bacterium]
MRPGITIRPLRTDAELSACVALQRLTWGESFGDLVPPSILTVVQKIGGVAAGAFAARGTMLGFVFGMAGVRNGRLVHWSDMLAVHPSARDSGVGRALKEFQREQALASGATTMYWSFDPLVARNAHLNFNLLGVRIDEYVEDMYGESTSDLHRGLGTDRLVVAWELTEGGRGRGPATAVVGTAVPDAWSLAPIIPEDPETSGGDVPRALRVAIPSDIMQVRDEHPEEAARWRASTRRAFQWALAHGYTVSRFLAAAPASWYLLERAEEQR